MKFYVVQLPEGASKFKLSGHFQTWGGDCKEFYEAENYAVIVFRNEAVFKRAKEQAPKSKFLGKHSLKIQFNEPQASTTSTKHKQTKSHTQGEVFPYNFQKRVHGEKRQPEALHDVLGSDRLDIAFEVTWKTLTPTALNPCEDTGKSANFDNGENGNAGYNLRWYMNNNRLAISPFTVKSAVANGFANLLGGCYRVMNRTIGHKDLTEGTYPYGGAIKRYRVNMGRSKPAVVMKVSENEDGSRTVTLQPVREYFLKSDLADQKLKPGEYYQAKTDKNKLVPETIKAANNKTGYCYHGPYRHGMNNSLGPGEFGTKSHHRFYKHQDAPVTGKVSRWNFLSREQLESEVYTGKFKRLEKKVGRTTLPASADPRQNLENGPWHQDMTTLKPGDFVYYEIFGNGDLALGWNYQFKTFFHHEDTVPKAQKACDNPDELCPRCRMFGMAGKEGEERKVVGFGSRFKAQALVNGLELEEATIPGQVPFLRDSQEKKLDSRQVDVSVWKHGDKEIARQVLMPILGPPKPSKRDVDGYFHPGSGEIKGAKVYVHASGKIRDLDSLKNFIDGVDKKTQANDSPKDKMPYAHDMRPWAHVCETGLEFTGTLGAENADAQEIAALLLLLESRRADHGFKLGLGKSIGLGSVASSVKAIWVRSRKDYTWQKIEAADLDAASLVNTLEDSIPGLGKEVANLKNAQKVLSTRGMDQRNPAFPDPGQDYWKDVKWPALSSPGS